MDHVWTVARLEKACRKMFVERFRIRASECAPADAAVAVYTKPDTGPVVVLMDAHKNGLISSVLHECVHFVLYDTYLPFDKDLSERMIESVDDAVEKYINESPRRIAWWRREIGKSIEVRTRRR